MGSAFRKMWRGKKAALSRALPCFACFTHSWRQSGCLYGGRCDNLRDVSKSWTLEQRAQIRADLGEPSRVNLAADANDAKHFDEIWEFDMLRRGYSFSIALKNEVYSHAWNGWSLEREQTAQTEP